MNSLNAALSPFKVAINELYSLATISEQREAKFNESIKKIEYLGNQLENVSINIINGDIKKEFLIKDYEDSDILSAFYIIELCLKFLPNSSHGRLILSTLRHDLALIKEAIGLVLYYEKQGNTNMKSISTKELLFIYNRVFKG